MEIFVFGAKKAFKIAKNVVSKSYNMEIRSPAKSYNMKKKVCHEADHAARGAEYISGIQRYLTKTPSRVSLQAWGGRQLSASCDTELRRFQPTSHTGIPERKNLQ